MPDSPQPPSNYPGNSRALFGLWKALEAQKKPQAAGARATFEAAWSGADVTTATAASSVIRLCMVFSLESGF